MMRSPIAPSATATATSSRSAPSQSRRTEGLEEAVSSSGKFGEAPRHFLINAAAERRSVIARKLVSQPAGFAEIVGLCHAGLFPEFAQRRGKQILAFVEAALR